MIIGDKTINRNGSVFFIAEIGINHNGDIGIAKKLIDIAAACGADAVKFQKRVVEESFTEERLSRPYLTKNSWGKTYGEHKHRLELSYEAYIELKEYAHSNGLLFGVTPCDFGSVDLLERLGIDFFKTASGDLTNLPLIRRIAKVGKPMIVSTGMSNMDTVDAIYLELSKADAEFAFLSCTSTYPTPSDDVNLRVVQTYLDRFDCVIGYSGHELGFIPTIGAVTLGARIVERHITLDRTMRGSDHIGSLDPRQLEQVVFGIRELEKSLGDGVKEVRESEKPFMEKLTKSVVLKRDVKKGEVLGEDNLCMKHPGGEISGMEWDGLVGKQFVKNCKKDELLQCDHFM